MVSLSNHADVEAEDVGQKPRQTLEGNALGEAQIDEQRAQVLPERRAGLHPARWRGLEFSRAAGAGAAMQRDARDIGRDVGDLDMVIGLADKLRRARHVGPTMPAGVREYVARRCRVRMQRPMRAGMGLVPGLGRHECRRLLSLARRRRGIGRRLRRQTELGFQLGNPLCQRIDPVDQSQDQRVLGRAVEGLKVGRLDHPSL